MKRAHVELRKRVQARMQEAGISQNDAAQLVDADSGQFSRLMRGEGLPGVVLGGRISEVFGVEIQWWGQEPLDETETGSGEHAAVTEAAGKAS